MEYLDTIKDILEFFCDFSWNFYYCAVPFLKALNFWTFESVSFFTIGTFNTRVLVLVRGKIDLSLQLTVLKNLLYFSLLSQHGGHAGQITPLWALVPIRPTWRNFLLHVTSFQLRDHMLVHIKIQEMMSLGKTIKKIITLRQNTWLC